MVRAIYPAPSPSLPTSFAPVNLLEVCNLKVHFPVKHGVFSRVNAWVKAVHYGSHALSPNRWMRFPL
jgi:ABC-type microcin C transport system duplicated ATPase subunit YejF